MENYHLSIHMAFWKESMINQLSNLINRNRSAAKISQVLCSNQESSLDELNEVDNWRHHQDHKLVPPHLVDTRHDR